MKAILVLAAVLAAGCSTDDDDEDDRPDQTSDLVDDVGELAENPCPGFCVTEEWCSGTDCEPRLIQVPCREWVETSSGARCILGDGSLLACWSEVDFLECDDPFELLDAGWFPRD